MVSYRLDPCSPPSKDRPIPYPQDAIDRAMIARFVGLDAPDFSGSGTFLALGHRKFNPLSLLEGAESSIPIDSGIVDEHVSTRITGNKPKAFLFVEPFDGSCFTCSHFSENSPYICCFLTYSFGP